MEVEKQEFSQERQEEFGALGVTRELQQTKEFREFTELFRSDAPADRILELYRSSRPEGDLRPMGSLKSSAPQDSVVKEFYTRDEALRFTRKDLDRNPELYRAVTASMGKW